MNPLILLSGAILVIVMSFITVRAKELSSALLGAGLTLLWIALSVFAH